MVYPTIIVPFLAGISAAVAAPVEGKVGDIYNGKATWYTQYGVYGSCGQLHADTDPIIAVSHEYPSNSLCGMKVAITNTGGGLRNMYPGKTVYATVADTCMGCGVNHIDLSEGLWRDLHGPDMSDGVFSVRWEFVGNA